MSPGRVRCIFSFLSVQYATDPTRRRDRRIGIGAETEVLSAGLDRVRRALADRFRPQ
jgi:hypothetical protein